MTLKATKLPAFAEQSPIFYGWIVWGVATVGLIASSPGQSFTVSLFFDHFIQDFELSRTMVSGMYGLGTFIGSLSLTWVGRQIDRFGNRKVTLAVATLFSLALLLWSTVVGPLGLLIGFVAVRGLGQGSLTLTNSTVIAQWFQKRRGRMMSITLLIWSLLQALYIPWLQRTLEVYDWRQVWIMLGVGVAVMVLPLTWFFMRDRPEDHGLRPDGISGRQKKKNEAARIVEPEVDDDILNEDNWSLREAMQTPIFWILVFGRLLAPSWVTGLVLHQVSIFTELGFDARIAAETYAMMTVVAAVMSLVFGYLIDNIRPSYVMAIQLTALIAAMFCATIMTASWLLMVYALVLGVVMGSGGVFDGAVWANVFGRLHQGSIRGFVSTTLVAASAAGPVLFGLSFDNFGSYQPVLYLGIVLAIVPLVLSFFVNKPERRESTSAA